MSRIAKYIIFWIVVGILFFTFMVWKLGKMKRDPDEFPKAQDKYGNVQSDHGLCIIIATNSRRISATTDMSSERNQLLVIHGPLQERISFQFSREKQIPW